MANITQNTTKSKEEATYKNYLENTAKINDFVVAFVKESKGLKTPYYTAIAEGTGLHYNTVLNHYKELKFKPMNAPQRSFTPNVINNLYNQTHKSPAAAKLWFQIMEGWTEKMEVQTDLTINVQLPDGLLDE